jgi:hypothetical protein
VKRAGQRVPESRDLPQGMSELPKQTLWASSSRQEVPQAKPAKTIAGQNTLVVSLVLQSSGSAYFFAVGTFLPSAFICCPQQISE